LQKDKKWYYYFMNTSKPLVLFDFDGVFNPVGKTETDMPVLDDHLQQIIKLPFGYGIFSDMIVHVNQVNIDFFNNLTLNSALEVKWLTTWQQDTELFPEALNFKPAPWVKAEADPERLLQPKEARKWWKLYTIQNIVKSNPKTNILWVDDDINDDMETISWLAATKTVQALVPNYLKGLTLEDRELITKFIS
jgi:hypothetical protein